MSARQDTMQRRSRLTELLKQEGPVGDDRQEEMAILLEAEAGEQDRCWRRIFAALAAALALAYMYLGLRQHFHPYDLRHHAAFAGAFASWVVSALELASGACMATTGLSMLSPHGRHGRSAKLMRTWRFPAALLLALAWCPPLFLTWQAGSSEPLWHYAWLPLGPLGFTLLLSCVDAWLAESVRAAMQLRTQMYNYKEL